MSETVKLIENFVSWQGEGPDSGQAMIILRFKSCNLKCPWCDTAVKMRISAEAPHALSDIQNTVIERNAGLLITGGEPTVDRHFKDSLSLLNEISYPVANVESNGYNLKELIKETDPSKKVRFIYSPKIFDESDLTKTIDMTDELIYHEKVYIKVVYEDRPLIKKYLDWLSNQISLGEARKVWLMPEGITRADLIRNAEGVFDACEKYKFNFSSRSHIIFGFV
jgi:organic radical activating enzyme